MYCLVSAWCMRAFWNFGMKVPTTGFVVGWCQWKLLGLGYLRLKKSYRFFDGKELKFSFLSEEFVAGILKVCTNDRSALKFLCYNEIYVPKDKWVFWWLKIVRVS